MNSISHDRAEAIYDLFSGRKIVEVDQARGLLVLDNGTVLELEGNEGCGGCANGYFSPLGDLATVDNIITRAWVECREDEDSTETYGLYVLADDRRINVASFQGHDNGYYGVGFAIHVRSAK